MDFNAALVKLGDFGVYQKRLCLLLILPSTALYVLILYSQFFILLVPPHVCKGSNSTGPDPACHRYLEVVPNRTQEVPCDTGWDYDYSVLFPTVPSEKDWVCEYSTRPFWVQTVFYLGFTVGAGVFGHVADRRGRRPSILMAYTLCCIAGLFSAYVGNTTAFIFLRFLVGASCSPIVETTYILAIEYIGKDKRTYPLVTSAIGFAVFPALYPLLPRLVRDWRILCIVASSPLLPFLALFRYIPESACWLLAAGRRAEAIRQLRAVGRINGNDIPAELDLLSVHKREDGVKGETQQEKPLVENAEATEPTSPISKPHRQEVDDVSLLTLFKMPGMRTQTLILALVWFVTTGCYHATILNSPNLGADVYESFALGGVMELPSVVVLLVAMDRLGRRWTMFLSMVVCGLAGVISILIPHKGFLGVGLIQRVALTTQYSVVAQYSTEVYPTVVRSRALALLNLVGTAGICLSPLVVYLAISWPALPLLLAGLLDFFVALVTLFLPETLNRHLPHTMKEGEQFAKATHTICHFPCLQGSTSSAELNEDIPSSEKKL